MTISGPILGILHEYSHGLTAFEFSSQKSKNLVLFVGGLTNGLLDVPYVEKLSSAIQTKFGNGETWSLAQVLLTSSNWGWGFSSLYKDTNELTRAVEYFRSATGGSRRKIILMGHSTGCQDIMEYITREWYKPCFSLPHIIDGTILQAPVSDVEGLAKDHDQQFISCLLEEIERDYLLLGNMNHVLPQKFSDVCWGYPISAYRFYSLFKPRQDDDYFSSYLNEHDFQQSFAKIPCPLLILYSTRDEFVPTSVDKHALMDSWKRATPVKYWSPLCKLIQGATHDLGPKSDPGAQDEMVDTVIQFIKSIRN